MTDTSQEIISTKKYKIILVDDDKFILNMYSMKFSKSGMEVVSFSDSQDALEKIKGGEQADIIMVDMVMPGIDGIELLSKIKGAKLLPSATFIVLSNQGQPSDIDRAKEIGVDGYIVKATSVPSEVLKEVLRIVNEKNKNLN